MNVKYKIMKAEVSLNKINNNLLDTITEEETVFKPLLEPIQEVDTVEEKIEIKEILSIKLLKLMADLEDKITNGRIKDKDTEKIRIDYYKNLKFYSKNIEKYRKM